MKRFYTDVSVNSGDDAFWIELDGRPVKTALGNRQILPNRALADDMAREWSAQGDPIDVNLFRRRDLADYAIDLVAPDTDAAAAKLLPFLETDTLCYRADPGEPFFRKQEEIWEPIIGRFEQEEGIRLERVSGIVHRPQPGASLARMRDRLAAMDHFALASLQSMTSLAASLSIGLLALAEDADAEALWNAANLEEDWQIEQWGEDSEALAVRKRRTADFMNAFEFARLARA